MKNEDAQNIGVTYCVNQARKILHSNGNRGPIDYDLFRERVVRKVAGKTLATWSNIIGTGNCQLVWRNRNLSSVDCRVDKTDFNDMWKIHRFISGHGPCAAVGIGQIETIAGMRRMGIDDADKYIDILDSLDNHPPESLKCYAKRIGDIAKGIE